MSCRFDNNSRIRCSATQQSRYRQLETPKLSRDSNSANALSIRHLFVRVVLNLWQFCTVFGNSQNSQEYDNKIHKTKQIKDASIFRLLVNKTDEIGRGRDKTKWAKLKIYPNFDEHSVQHLSNRINFVTMAFDMHAMH